MRKFFLMLGCCLMFSLVAFAQKQIYVVQSGDNLSRIAVQFGMNTLELKKLNELENDKIREGQKIWVIPKKTASRPEFHIVEGGESLYKIASQYQISVQDLKAWNQLNSEEISVGQKLNLSPKNTETPLKTTNNKDLKTVKEMGMGSKIPPTESDAKLALHATAPEGTMVQVYHESQGKSVTVKVIGKLSQADIDRQVIIKLSQAAWRALGIVNEEFPVVLVYQIKKK